MNHNPLHLHNTMKIYGIYIYDYDDNTMHMDAYGESTSQFLMMHTQDIMKCTSLRFIFNHSTG